MSEWTLDQWVAHGREWIAAGWDPRDAKGGPALFMAALVSRDGHVRLANADGALVNGSYSEVVPYLADAGTRGHALDQVRLAWDEPRANLDYDDGQWWLNTDGQRHRLPVCGPDAEHEALLAARRSAP